MDRVPFIGTMVQMVGEVKIVEIGEKLVKADVVSLSGTARRGDKLIKVLPPVNWAMKFDPPKELQCHIMMGEEPDMRLFVQGQLVLIDKGTVDGMKEGFIFRAWRDTDPHTEQDIDVEPTSKGEVQIVHAGVLSSVGYIVRNFEPLRIGDTLIPRQAFANPPRANIRRVGEPLEIP